MTGLRVADLTVGRGGLRLLEGLSFEVAAGSAVSIHGRNGLGKTTLLRTLAGLTPPMAGRLHHDPETVAYSAHADGIKPTLTVAEMLGFWAGVYGAQTQVEEALAVFEAQALAARPGAVLSAGQRRRVALARLVLSGRAIWLMDEPMAGLDAAGRVQLAQAVEAHLAAGGAALMVNHGAPPLPCATLELDAFAAQVTGGDDAFAEAVE